MPYVLLDWLARTQLPADVPAAEDIHKLLSLRAAGLIHADIPAFVHDRNGGRYVGPARVLAVTPAGVAAIKKRRS